MEGFLADASILSALLAFFSPVIAMFVARSTVRYAPYPYAYGFTSCALWINFGLHYDLDALWRLSIFGLLAYAAYLLVFLCNSEAGDARRAWLRYVVGVCAAVLFAGLLLRTFASDAAYDNFCSAVACFTSAAPLWNVPAAFWTKSADTMPSRIVAGAALVNAMFWTWRNTFGAKTKNLNLTIPSCVALFSALVQVVVHLVCWCLPVPVPVPPPGPPSPGIDPRPLLWNQTEAGAGAGGSGHVLDDSDHGLSKDDDEDAKARETRVNIPPLEDLVDESMDMENLHDEKDFVDAKNETPMDIEKVLQDAQRVADAKKETGDIDNIPAAQDAQRKVLVTDAKKETMDTRNLPVLQLQDGQRVADAKKEAVDIENIPAAQDGRRKVLVADAKNKIMDMRNLPVLQDGQGNENKVVDEGKPAQGVASDESSTTKVEKADPAVPQQEEKA